MGYDTRYELEIDCPESDRQRLHDHLMMIEGASFALDVKINGLIYGSNGRCSWYEWKSDICFLSKKFPSVTFTLSGEGENSADMWRAIFHDGKFKLIEPKIIWPTNDEIESFPWNED